mgnify:CR=1 FL=1
MSINNVSKQDMIAWFECNDQVDSLLSFAMMRELKRTKYKSDQLISEMQKLQKQAVVLLREANQTPDEEGQYALLKQAADLFEQADELGRQESNLWKKVERI